VSAEPGVPALAVDGLRAGYGPLTVLRGVSLEVGRGEVVGVLGANSAGKTTLMRAVAGVVRPSAGRVLLHGEDVTADRDYARTRAGIGHVPSGRELFGELSVGDNIDLGAYRVPRARSRELRSLALDLFPKLATMLDRRAAALSGGEQQMLAFARALMTDPTVLLLDEPSTGLAPAIVETLFDALRRLIAEADMSVLLVEQNAELALGVVSRAYVVRHGEVVLSGAADELQSVELAAAYLGA
jgi:branched-chain amino acid transport system ATP-binding protein